MEFTVTVRPLRWLRNLVLVTLAIVACWVPVRLAADRAPRTPAQLAHENATRSVDAVLRVRMSYLDDRRRAELTQVVIEESLSCQLDPLFVLSVGEVESHLDHEAVSPTGARGLFQVTPGTWKAEVQRRRLGHLEKFNVVHNARVGIGYLCHLKKQFRRPESVLLAYNQGPGGALAIIRGEAEPSPEAASYGAKVWRTYRHVLAFLRLPNTPNWMRRLWRSPTETIYRPGAPA